MILLVLTTFWKWTLEIWLCSPQCSLPEGTYELHTRLVTIFLTVKCLFSNYCLFLFMLIATPHLYHWCKYIYSVSNVRSNENFLASVTVVNIWLSTFSHYTVQYEYMNPLLVSHTCHLKMVGMIWKFFERKMCNDVPDSQRFLGQKVRERFYVHRNSNERLCVFFLVLQLNIQSQAGNLHQENKNTPQLSKSL